MFRVKPYHVALLVKLVWQIDAEILGRAILVGLGKYELFNLAMFAASPNVV